ncbi:MAG: transglutaminase N-terminal domain-containing protein, partial [Gammaproteobacteria bacterium]
MKYRIVHITTYHYSQPVGLCQNEARLQPRKFWRQQCLSSHYEIDPVPADFHSRTDFFGNDVAYFAIQQSHAELTVTTTSEVELSPEPKRSDTAPAMAWEQVRELLQAQRSAGHEENPDVLEAKQFVLDSP